MARFAVLLEYGEDEARRNEVRPAHREYVKGLVGKGQVLASGPFTDGKGAQLVYDVADEAELRKIIEADPYTAAGVIASTTVRQWDIVSGPWAQA